MNFATLSEKLWPFRWPLALCLVLMLTESIATLAVPWLGGCIVGSLLSSSQLTLGGLAGGLIGLFVFQALLKITQRRILGNTAEKLTAGLRIELYNHLQRLPLPWLDERRGGDLLSLIMWEVDELCEFATSAVLGILPKLLVLAGAITLMLRIDLVLTLPIMLGVPIFYLILKLLGRNIRPLAGELREAHARTVSLAEENFSILQAIKAYTREGLETRRFSDHVFRYRDLQKRMIGYQSVLGPSLQLVAATAVVLVLWLAGSKITEGAMTSAEMVSFLLYAGLLTRPVAGFTDLWGQFQHARGALKHMEEALAIRPEAQGGDGLTEVKGAIRFEKVHFGYPERPPLLTGITFDIAAGETVAITGENGAGKTTLMDLLMRFRNPDSGRVLLDGHDISELALAAYRRQIALVPQRIALIDGTIADNIRFGSPEATLAQIETAAREAEAWGFIDKLPDGFGTLIGERGIRLSGGQRQRLALARALLKNPAILLLDEPTAMFDPEGEERFVEIARTALKGRTVILITHRPSSLVLADRIVKLHRGALGGSIVTLCDRQQEEGGAA